MPLSGCAALGTLWRIHSKQAQTLRTDPQRIAIHNVHTPSHMPGHIRSHTGRHSAQATYGHHQAHPDLAGSFVNLY
jgi:hypothetical protein